MAGQSLFRQCGPRPRKSENEDRLRTSLPYRRQRHQPQAIADEELPQATGDLLRLLIEIILSGDFARQSLGLVEADEGLIVAPHPVEDPALLEQRVGVRTSLWQERTIFVASRILLEFGKRRRKLAFAREQRRPCHPQPGIIGTNLRGPIQLCPGGGEIAVGFLELAPPEQRLEDVRRRFDGFVVERPRLRNPSLALQVPGQVGQQDRVARTGNFQDATIMKLSDMRTLGFSQNHAHQVMRHRMHRGETHRISRMMFGAGQVAPLEQQHCQFLGGVDVIWRDSDEPLQQRQRRLLAASHAGGSDRGSRARPENGARRPALQGLLPPPQPDRRRRAPSPHDRQGYLPAPWPHAGRRKRDPFRSTGGSSTRCRRDTGRLDARSSRHTPSRRARSCHDEFPRATHRALRQDTLQAHARSDHGRSARILRWPVAPDCEPVRPS